MRLLLIQERGRHPENQQYREALCLARALVRQDVECVVWGRGYAGFSRPFAEVAADCDAVLTLENYDTGWHPDLSEFSRPKLFWSIDSHCALEAHLAFCRRHRIDVLLNSSAQYLPRFNGVVGRGYWFPNCYPADLIAPAPVSAKRYNLGFCGSLIGARREWLDAIERHLPVRRDIGVLGAAMVDAIGSYRIALNRSIADDLNYRVFETLGRGTFLLTNPVPGIDQLFRLGEELVTASGLDDLVDKCRYYLAHPEQRERIAAQGLAAVQARHTYDRRAEQLRTILSDCIGEAR